jgi:hypothetical protein
MELADGVIIWFGGPIIALDEATGRRLWERPLSKGYQSAVAGNALWLMDQSEVVKIDARSGKVHARYATPSLPDRGARFDLVVDGERIALVEANVRTPETVEGFVFTWTASAPVPVVLRRPAGTDIFAMRGDVLFAAAGDDGRLVAVDLRAAEGPLATLSTEAAVAAVMSDPNEHTWDAQLERLPEARAAALGTGQSGPGQVIAEIR